MRFRNSANDSDQTYTSLILRCRRSVIARKGFQLEEVPCVIGNENLRMPDRWLRGERKTARSPP